MERPPVATVDRAFVRAHDWSRTGLGPFGQWPRTLQGYVDMVLEMPTPAIIFWGPDQTQIYNSGYAVIMGPRHPKYFGAPYRECWPDTYPVIHPWMRQVLERGEVIQVTRTLFTLTRHGYTEEAYFTFTFSPLRDDAGAIAGILQPVVEVTDAVLAERRSETLRALAPRAHSPNGMADAAEALAANPKDIPFALVYLAQEAGGALALAASAGCAPGAASAPAAAVALEAYRANAARAIEDATALLGKPHVGAWQEPTRQAYAMPLRRSAADAPVGAALFGLSPRLPFDDRYREFLEAIARELAANLAAAAAKKAEQELLAREQAARREAELQKENLVALLTQAPAPMVLLRGPELVVELANNYACRLWRREPAEVLDRPLLLALPELRGQRFDELLRRVYASGQTYVGTEFPARLGREDGTQHEVYLNFVYAPLRNVAGEVEGILVIGLDVTEQVRARQQVTELRDAAEAANRAKDEFLAMLGHELRNPLAPILTALQLMHLRGDAHLVREREVIERQATHLVRLVDDLLDVSRITRGKIELHRERIDLAEALARAIEVASPLLEQRQQQLAVDAHEPGLAVQADAARLTQIFSNLLTNAAKYTEPGGRIQVSIARRGAQAEVRVADTGIGIDAAMLPRVFELFVQGSQALDRSRGGLGLGLAIVRSLVELHGGSVEARSEGLGRGSEFVVRLPAAAAAASAARQPRSAPRLDGDGRRILIVDDNEDAAHMLAASLQALGHATRVAHDGAAALRLADEMRPELALLDIGLPVMSGYELARHLRQRPALAGLRLVAITGYGQGADRGRSEAAGFDAHLVKPVELSRLESVVRELTAR